MEWIEQTRAPVEGKIRVLVIDDEVSILTLMGDILGPQYDVESVSTGSDALRRLATDSYDVVLCDLGLPDLNGREIHAWLAANRPGRETGMLFMSGDTAANRAFLIRAGNPCLAKPFTVVDLRDAVARMAQTSSAAALALAGP